MVLPFEAASRRKSRSRVVAEVWSAARRWRRRPRFIEARRGCKRREGGWRREKEEVVQGGVPGGYTAEREREKRGDRKPVGRARRVARTQGPFNAPPTTAGRCSLVWSLPGLARPVVRAGPVRPAGAVRCVVAAAATVTVRSPARTASGTRTLVWCWWVCRWDLDTRYRRRVTRGPARRIYKHFFPTPRPVFSLFVWNRPPI